MIKTPVNGLSNGQRNGPFKLRKLDPNAFVFSIDTSKAGSASNTFILPTTGSGYDCNIDWGDGSGAQYAKGTPGNITHIYGQTGIYQIKIRGIFPRIYFNNAGDKLKLMSIDQWGTQKWGANQANSYYGCTNMVGKYIDNPDTSAVTDMRYMFAFCNKFNSPVNFNTSKVQYMQYMFSDCFVFNQRVDFDTKNVTTFTATFYDCFVFNQPLNWNTANVTSFVGMFRMANHFDQDLSGWNISSVTDMTHMFWQLETMYVNEGLSLLNYNKLLASWGSQTVQTGVVFDAYDFTYDDVSAIAGRANLINNHGWTINDGGPAFDNGKFIINHDDGSNSQYYNGFSILTELNLKATFYIVSDYISVDPSSMTWAQLQELNAAGMDIECHTKSHLHMDYQTDAVCIAQFQGVNDAFAANSLPQPWHTAYPFGVAPLNKSTMDGLRVTGRGVVPGFIKKTTDKLTLPTYNFTMDINEVKDAIDYAKLNKRAMMCYGHGVDYDNIPIAVYREILQYAIDSGIDIITISELYALMT